MRTAIFPWFVNFISKICIVKSKPTLSMCKIWARTGRRKSCFSSTAVHSRAVANEEFYPMELSSTSTFIKTWCSQILFQWKLHYLWARSTWRLDHLSHTVPFHLLQPRFTSFKYTCTLTLHSFLSAGLHHYVEYIITNEISIPDFRHSIYLVSEHLRTLF
jgi:hypothetical protein